MGGTYSSEDLEVDFNISEIDISTVKFSALEGLYHDSIVVNRFLPTTQDEGIRFLEMALSPNTSLIIKYNIYVCGKTGRIRREASIMENENQEDMLRGRSGKYSGTAMSLKLYGYCSEQDVRVNPSEGRLQEASYWSGSFYTNGLPTATLEAKIK